MAVYLFTFHAYASWMPDRPRGYVKRNEGVLPPDENEAERYRDRQKFDNVVFVPAVQRVLVDTCVLVCAEKRWRLHQAATDASHLHALVSWTPFVEWQSVRRALRYRLTAELHRVFDAHRPWFSHGASRKRVRDRKHFDYLMSTYLPKHTGVSWRE